jgi:hypothetical protein
MNSLSSNGLRYSQVQSCLEAAEHASREHQRVIRLEFDIKVIEVMKKIMNRLKRVYSCLSFESAAACFVEAASSIATESDLIESTIVNPPAQPSSDDDNIAVEIVDVNVEDD